MRSVTDYYWEKYGEPARRAQFVSSEGIHINIFKWTESQTDEGVAIYATQGSVNTLCEANECCEFFIGIAPDVDEIIDALAEVALHGNGRNNVPNSGDTITLASTLWNGTQAKSFMFTNGDEIMPPLINGMKHISFIQLVPLFEAEMEYKKEMGESALWEKFEEENVPYWNSSRSSSF